MNANVPAFDGAGSLMRIGSKAQCERGMEIAAAVSPVVAEDHGRELGVHGDIDFCLCEIRDFESKTRVQCATIAYNELARQQYVEIGIFYMRYLLQYFMFDK